jgi:protein-disulfide isomerase
MTTEIVILSLACCSPSIKKYDDQLLENLQEAIKQTNISAEIKVLSAADLYASNYLENEYLKQVIPLTQKYGTAVAPLVFINGKLELYGGVPSVEKIVERLNSLSEKT